MYSLGFTLGVVRFILGRLVHSGSPFGPFGSSWVIGFTRVRAGSLWVHAGSLGSLRFALGVIAFIRGSLGSLGFASVNLPWGSMGSSEVVAFTRVCPWGRWVHPGSLGSIKFALGFTGFIRGRWVHLGSSWVSMGSSVVVGLLAFAMGVVGFTGVRLGGRWVHSVSP